MTTVTLTAWQPRPSASDLTIIRAKAAEMAAAGKTDNKPANYYPYFGTMPSSSTGVYPEYGPDVPPEQIDPIFTQPTGFNPFVSTQLTVRNWATQDDADEWIAFLETYNPLVNIVLPPQP